MIARSVTEGDQVSAGQATVVDDKLDFRLAKMAARHPALAAQLAKAGANLVRREKMLKTGVTTTQRVDVRRPQVDVLMGQIAALQVQAAMITQQGKEGRVLSLLAGRVLAVPVTNGAVALPGAVVASIGGCGTYLRSAVPERPAGALQTGGSIRRSGPRGHPRKPGSEHGLWQRHRGRGGTAGWFDASAALGGPGEPPRPWCRTRSFDPSARGLFAAPQAPSAADRSLLPHRLISG